MDRKCASVCTTMINCWYNPDQLRK